MNKNNYNFWKKAMVLAIICLFLGTGVVPSIGGNIREDSSEDIGKEPLKDFNQDDSKTASSSQDVDWWPMFHHDAQHTGYSTAKAPDTNSILWNYKTGACIEWSSPAVVDGKVYIGSGDYNIYCFNIATGDLIWDYTTGDLVESSPAVVDGKVYIGSHDYNVYCLDANTGDKIWNYSTYYYVCSSPSVANDKVYIGSTDRNVYCLNASTGKLIWNYETDAGVYSIPAVVDDRVYIGSGYKDGRKVYCLNATTGEHIWNYTTDGEVYSCPAVVDSKVYIGSCDRNVYCLDAAKGKLIWNFTTGGRVGSSPAVVDGGVYIGSDDGKFYCLDAATGGHRWNYTYGSQTYSSPAVTDDNVYIAAGNWVYCIDVVSGNLRWKYKTDGWIGSSPAIADGKLFIGSSDGNVYAFGNPGTNHPPNTPSTPSGPSSNRPGIMYTYSASTTDPDNDIVRYGWDWYGDDVVDEWTNFYVSGIKVSTSHMWTISGTYDVKVKAEDSWGVQSSWSPTLPVVIDIDCNNPPNKPSRPDGPTSGKTGVKYTYSTSAVDPDGDQIKCYLWDWGDGTENRTYKCGPFDSGEVTYAEHVWEEAGNYKVKVWAEDINGGQSLVSDPLLISMPKSKPSFDSPFWFFDRLLDRFPFLEQILFNLWKGGK